jgi:hypothetical protein
VSTTAELDIYRAANILVKEYGPESALKGRCDGYAAFLRKPFKINDVHQIVRNVVGGARST